MTRAFFYDTWAFVALANDRDRAHPVAEQLDRALEQGGFYGVTSDYVLDETITFLQSGAGARVSIAFLDQLEDRLAASEIRLIEIGEARRAASFQVFRKLAASEPRLSFTDATSFVVMAELGIELAFTADRHFHRAGKGIGPLVEASGKRLIARPLPSM